MTERAKRNTKAFITGCIIGGFCLWVTLSLPGCSTVEGFAKDLDSVSRGVRGADD
jgi:predicted small secreted protein